MHFLANAVKSTGPLLRIIDNEHELMCRKEIAEVAGERCNSAFAQS
jgi:hypothetical protein